MNKKYSFVLLSGGIGSRMQNNIPKQYMLLAGKPVIMHSLEKADAIDLISEIVVVCSDDYKKTIMDMAEQYGIRKTIIFASAGKTRQASVLSGLKKVNNDNVIIHEAARPFVKVENIEELINNSSDNAIIGSRIPFTVVEGNNEVSGLLDRSKLINVQLPQKFQLKPLLESHLKAENDSMEFTEDASLLHYYQPEIKISVIEGKDYNIKLTNRIDMLVGEIIYDEFFRRRK